jgi:hypothetical protein
MGRIRDFVRTLGPGDDRALAAQLRQKEQAREQQRKAQEEADRKARARRHKQELARKGSGAKLF